MKPLCNTPIYYFLILCLFFPYYVLTAIISIYIYSHIYLHLLSLLFLLLVINYYLLFIVLLANFPIIYHLLLSLVS